MRPELDLLSLGDEINPATASRMGASFSRSFWNPPHWRAGFSDRLSRIRYQPPSTNTPFHFDPGSPE